MLTDIEFFTTKLGKLDGFGDAGDYLLRIIKSKNIERPKPAETEETLSEKTSTEDKEGDAKEVDKTADSAEEEKK